MGKSRSTGRKVTGVSGSALGFGVGVSTSTTTTERDVVQALIIFLEDRRVLFNPDDLEEQSQVNSSVQEIRAELTEALQQVDPQGLVAAALRLMRSSCRQYLDDPRLHFRFIDRCDRPERRDNPGFLVALGGLRAMFGLALLQLDQLFALEMEPQLRGLLPKPDVG